MTAELRFRCVRCETPYDASRDWFGCPACADDVPANLEVEYTGPVRIEPAACGARPPGVWRYEEALPLAREEAVSLGEGGTPLVPCPGVGGLVGVPALLAKNESQNPTWSFKDRLATVAVSWARAQGRSGVAVSSSGNAGASVAAYCARAGLPCVVFTTRAFPGAMQRFMRSFGAMVVATESPQGRWTLNRLVAEEWGWLPFSNTTSPPVGSYPVAVEGAKTIAYEIAQDLGWQAPDAVVVPVAYGDSFAGIHRGFRELVEAGAVDRMPRLVAVEAYPSLSKAIAESAPGPPAVEGSGSLAHSVATPQGTYQALRAIRGSGGLAVAVSNAETAAAHAELREREGLFVEFSAAMPLAAVRRLVEAGELSADARVVMVITSSGLKDSEITSREGEIPLVQETLPALRRVLEGEYGLAA